MKNSVTLNLKESTMIIINLICIKLLFNFPQRLVINSGNAAWIQIIYVSLIMTVLFFITTIAYRRCSNMSIIGLSEKIGGKPLKAVVGLIVSGVLLLNIVPIIRNYPDMVKLVLLPNTPIEMILLIFTVVIGIAVYVGMDAIARIHAIVVPIVLIIMAAFYIFLIPHVKVYNLFPILGNGANRIFGKGLLGIEFFDDILVLNLLLPYMQNADDAKKTGYRAIIISSALAIIMILIYGLIYPYPSSGKFIAPIYQLTRLVGIGDFFQRFEAFFEFVWSLGVFLYLSFYISVICMVWKESFDLKYERPLIYPITALAAILAFNVKDTQEIILEYWYFAAGMLSVIFILPIIIPVIYKIKNK